MSFTHDGNVAGVHEDKPENEHGETSGPPHHQAYVSQVPNPPGNKPEGVNGEQPRASRHQAFVSQVTSPEFQKLANPGPLGLLGFAVTTFVLGLYQCGVGLPGFNPEGSIGPDQSVFGLAIFMGGFAQFVAGIMEYRVGNTFGTTVHCSYGAFWLSYAMFLVPSLGIEAAYGGDKRAYTFSLGVYLITWCILTFIFFIAALRTNYTILGVFFFLVLAFLFLSIAAFIATEHPTASVRVNKAGGAFTVICASIAFYAGGSGLMISDTTFVRFPLGAIPTPDDTV